MQEQNFYQCQNSEHEFKPILGVCLNPNCSSLKPYCHFCMQEFHIDHVNDLKDFNSVIQWSKNKLPIYGQLQEGISNLKKILTILNQWSDRMQIDDQYEIFQIGIEGLDRLISKQLILENLEKTIEELNQNSYQILEILQTTNKVVQQQIFTFEERKHINDSPLKKNSDTNERTRKSYFNAIEQILKNKNPGQVQVRAQSSQMKSVKTKDNSKSDIKSNVERKFEEQYNLVTPKREQPKQGTIKKEVSVIQSEIIEVPQIVQQQMSPDPEEIPADSKYRFSKTLKFDALKIQKNGFVVTGSGGFALCEPLIQIGQDVKFGFKINKSDSIYLGICNNVIASVSRYNLFLSEVGHGSYLISNNGQVYSTLEPELNNQKKGFTFGCCDQIVIEVSMSLSKITWILANKKKQFSMKIEPNKCLYPCVKLSKYQFSCEPEVEILNY